MSNYCLYFAASDCVVTYTIKTEYTVSPPPKSHGVFLLCMKLQSITSMNDSPVTLTVSSPSEIAKPVCDTVEPRSTLNRMMAVSSLMRQPHHLCFRRTPGVQGAPIIVAGRGQSSR